MAVSFNKEVISKAIQEVLAEKTIIASKAKKMQQQQDVAKDSSIPSSVKPAVKKALDQATDGEEIEVPTNETLSVGHVDDEPGMLKQFAFDTAEYAAKLYKLLHHYEQMEDHVDFPNWWQHKVMMAREYMSKATHYLEFETMKPQIDAAVDGHSEEELDEARDYQALVGKTVQYGGRTATVEGEEGDYIRLKFEDGKENLISKSDFENKEPYVNEDDDVEPSKKDIKAAEKDVKNVSDDKKQQFNRALAFIKKFKDNPGAVAGMLKKAKEEYKLPKNLLKDLARAAQVSETLAEGVSCCGRCGRVHESAQDCKKPYISKDSPRHCKNKK